MWNANDAVAHLEQHVLRHSIGRCAEHVRQAIEAGGVRLVRHASAKNYGSSLAAVGFTPLSGHLHCSALATWPSSSRLPAIHTAT